MIIDIRMDDVASSNIKRIKYEASSDNKDMFPIFAIKGTLTITYSNDSVYNYLDVPASVAGNLFINDSVGKFISSYVKKMYESEKVGN